MTVETFRKGEWVQTRNRKGYEFVPDGTTGYVVNIESDSDEIYSYLIQLHPAKVTDPNGVVRGNVWLPAHRLARFPPVDIPTVVGALQSTFQELESM